VVAEDAEVAHVGEFWDLGDEIFATPACTLEGVVVKLRVADRMNLQRLADENEGLMSVAADIRRLAAGATS
jgi:hypothetical protein